jgi:hypothetical protein
VFDQQFVAPEQSSILPEDSQQQAEAASGEPRNADCPYARLLAVTYSKTVFRTKTRQPFDAQLALARDPAAIGRLLIHIRSQKRIISHPIPRTMESRDDENLSGRN